MLKELHLFYMITMILINISVDQNIYGKYGIEDKIENKNIDSCFQIYSSSIPFADDFETYTAGIQLTVQNSVDWQTWSGGIGTNEDPYISNNYANSSPNSLVIAENNDIVKTYGSLNSGDHLISFMTYIPAGKKGYFNTMSGFTPNPFEWAMECYIDTGGIGRLVNVPGSPVSFSYPIDTWFPVEVVVGLDQDYAALHVDGTVVLQWQWTQGGSKALQLDATDFFGDSDSEMYIDDFIFDYFPPLPGFEKEKSFIPSIFDLAQNYPNPFNPTTKINYMLPKSVNVRIEIFNFLGQKIETLLNKQMPAGLHQVTFNGQNLSSGIYCYSIIAGEFQQVKKMVLIK